MKKTVLVLFLFCLGISVFSQEQISVFQSNSLGKKDMLVHTTFSHARISPALFTCPVFFTQRIKGITTSFPPSRDEGV